MSWRLRGKLDLIAEVSPHASRSNDEVNYARLKQHLQYFSYKQQYLPIVWPFNRGGNGSELGNKSPVSPLLLTWCEEDSSGQPPAVEVVLGVKVKFLLVIWGKWLFRYPWMRCRGWWMYKVQSAFTFGLVFFVHCSSFAQTLILLHTSVRLHGEDEAALFCFLYYFLYINIYILSSTTELMIQVQLCYTSNSTWNCVWAPSIIRPGSLCSVPLSWGKLTFTSCINWPIRSTSLPPD